MMNDDRFFLQCDISTRFEPFLHAADIMVLSMLTVESLKNFKHIIMITPSSLGLNFDDLPFFENFSSTSRSQYTSSDAKIAKQGFCGTPFFLLLQN